ncbi:MAG: Bax inhibitor-1/YccA family protein [Erysipelotrichaceae bacterium]|nr:Bax inhibitor-1/YccA family protein [Erysipelotrichaceae bacterium]
MEPFTHIVRDEQNTFPRYLTRVFLIVLLGLLISFGVAFLMLQSGNALFYYFHPYIILILQLGIAWFFSFRLMAMERGTAWFCYIAYSAIMGLTFSVLPLIYDGRSILFAVGMTAVLFGCMAMIGHNTHVDLTKYSTYLFLGLFMIILITVVNFFFIHSGGLDLLLTYVGVLLFLAITAYDMQRLRALYLEGYGDRNLYEKLTIFGAFQLYLDFINLFIRILQIFGRRRD